MARTRAPALCPRRRLVSRTEIAEGAGTPRAGSLGLREAGLLTIDELRSEVEQGGIDTVVTAFTDMQGRLLGKREQAEFFLEQSAEHGIEGCNYLMALDMEMDPQAGYAMASWEQGYGDFVLTPDLATLRKVPWLEGTALVLCDVGLGDGTPLSVSP